MPPESPRLLGISWARQPQAAQNISQIIDFNGAPVGI
jgi:hypothetical protein